MTNNTTIKTGTLAGKTYTFINCTNKTNPKAYMVFRNMFTRCYNTNFLSNNPSYLGCTIDPSWYNFDTFVAWFNLNYIPGAQLDKDLLSGNSKIYSPSTCCFIDKRINTFLANKKRSNKTGFIGVSKRQDGRYRADVTDFKTSKVTYLGTFDRAIDAHNAYQLGRLEQVKECKAYAVNMNYPSHIVNAIK